MKIVVTGAAGFVGSWLSQALLERGDEVLGIDNFNPFYDVNQKKNNVALLTKYPSFRFKELDFRDGEKVTTCLSDFAPDVIAHMGALANVRYSLKEPLEFVDVNIKGTLILLEICKTLNIKSMVFASTSSIYGERENVPFYETDSTDLPLAPYPASKKAGELLGHAYHTMCGLNFTSVRFFNVYGPRGRPDMMPFKVTEKILAGEEIVLFDPEVLKRDWTYVEDIVSGVVSAIDHQYPYEVINLGRGEPILLRDFINTAESVLGKSAVTSIQSAPVSEPKQTFASIDKARKLLGYNPKTSFKEGYKAFTQWYFAR
jgi:UDP-glucuronate 4-epimerase